MKPIIEKQSPHVTTELVGCEVFRGPDFASVWHQHPEVEITLVKRGGSQRMVGDKISPLHPGDLVVIGPDLPHDYRNEALPGRKRPHVEAVVVQFLPNILGDDWLKRPSVGKVRRLFQRARFGLEVSGRTRQRASHNLLHDAPHMAVGIGGNDHVFEYNVVHDVCNASDDAGALYKGRNPSCRGNVIRYNLWCDIGSPMEHGTAAVYFDDGNGGDTVFGNIFVRCGYPGQGSFGTVFSHGGHDNLAENNVFIGCQRALGSAPWGDQRWKETIDGGHGCYWQKLLRQDVDITRPPYTTHYPALVGFMDPQPGQKRVNRAKNNVMVRCEQASSGNWEFKPDETWVTDQDPGFVNAAKGDYRLGPDAEVFKRLSGFTRIPAEKIGVYQSPLRAQWPIDIATVPESKHLTQEDE